MLNNNVIDNLIHTDTDILSFDIVVNNGKLKAYLFLISTLILYVHKNKNNLKLPAFKAFLKASVPQNLDIKL